jgi:signal transduction histidine kinase
MTRLAYIAAMRNWFRPPRHVLAIFVAVAVVSAAALSWLVWLLLTQEKAVEMQRRQDRIDQAAERAAAVMQAALADLDHASQPLSGLLYVRVAADELSVRPERSLLYYPEKRRDTAGTATRFDEGEQAEFARKDLKSAADLYRRLSKDPEISVRAGALARLARVQRRLHEYDQAIQTYDRLSEMTGVTVDGLPAALVARQGRVDLFEENHRSVELKREARALQADLRSGRWQITKSEYGFYSNEANARLGTPESNADADAIARAEAVVWLWENRHATEPTSRRVIQAGGSPALIVSHTTLDGLTAAVAGPNYLAFLCREAVPDPALQCSLSDAEGHPLLGPLPAARAGTTLTAAASKLPWTLQVSGDAEGTPSTQRRLLLWVAAVLAAVWLTGAVFIVRAIGREARVAQLQSDFVSAVSHEFRSPLSSLCQISEMLASNRFQSDELRRSAYSVLTRESERLRRLVKGLLDFQRLEAGAEVYHFERIEIREFLGTIIEDFRETVSDAGYTVELRGVEAGTHVKGDRDALSRVIWNLLDNAVKYSPECNTVWVDVECHENRVSIAVRDRGLGIPIHEQRDIFEKFVRGAESKTRRIKGTGVGLAMVQHIVQAHGGEILLASRPGEGSRFTIVFPQEAII